MRVTAIVPVFLIADANVLQLTVNRNSMDNMVNKVASTVVDRLLSRVVDASLTHPADLDDATIAKPRHRRSKTNVPLQPTAHTISKPTKRRGYFARMFGHKRDIIESDDPGNTISASLRPDVQAVSKPSKKRGYFARMFGRNRDSAESDSTGVDTFEKAKIASLPDDSELVDDRKEVPMSASHTDSAKESVDAPADAMPQRAELANDEPAQVAPADPKTGIAEREHEEVHQVFQVAQTLQSAVDQAPTPFRRGFLSPRKYIKPSEEEEEEMQSKRRKIWSRDTEDALRSVMHNQESSVNVNANSSPVRQIAAAAVQYPALAPEIVDKSNTMSSKPLKEQGEDLHFETSSDASREGDFIPSV